MEEQPYAPSFVVADSLDDLRGPTRGEVALPNRLLWNPSRPFDLADDDRRRSLIRIVLREARTQEDLAEFVDRSGLVRLWPSLGLPDAIASAWEARFPELTRSPATEPRRRLWADDHPDALQTLADQTIRVAEGLDERLGWQVPAGWIGIVNRLHADLVELLGEYDVIRAGNKLSYLRYAIDRHRRDDGGPDVWQAVNDRIAEAKAESLRTCDLCGGSAQGAVSFGVTRCQEHQTPKERRVPGARARPPGWSPQA